MSAVRVQPEVAEALRSGGAVVALETAVVTHGLPRGTLERKPRFEVGSWDGNGPINLQAARAMEEAVRSVGAVPATIAVLDGTLRIGLADAELVRLAVDSNAIKASTRDLAFAMISGKTAGTTISATLYACGVCPGGPIRVMATGGIGGVHRGWSTSPDVSADLPQLASTPVCVVCSGCKSILDLPATLQAVETLGIPLVGYRTDFLPQFYCAGTAQHRVPYRVDEVGAIAEMCKTHWQGIGARSAAIVANPVPAAAALNPDEIENAVAQAEKQATAAGISGSARTPYLLAEIARLTGGRSLDANLALLVSNAALAASLAVAMTRR